MGMLLAGSIYDLVTSKNKPEPRIVHLGNLRLVEDTNGPEGSNHSFGIGWDCFQGSEPREKQSMTSSTLAGERPPPRSLRVNVQFAPMSHLHTQLLLASSVFDGQLP